MRNKNVQMSLFDIYLMPLEPSPVLFSPMLCAVAEGVCRITAPGGVVKIPVQKGFLSVKDNLAELITEA